MTRQKRDAAVLNAIIDNPGKPLEAIGSLTGMREWNVRGSVYRLRRKKLVYVLLPGDGTLQHYASLPELSE